MKSVTFILLSPAPVDGYPPVQHQAKLLAVRGFEVILITVPRRNAARVKFECDGVEIVALPLRNGRGVQTARRLVEFSSALFSARSRISKTEVVEIAYDPLAMLISDYTPNRPHLRIAHFHESLDNFYESWMQRRLRRSIHGYQFVTVADENRGQRLASQLSLRSLPLVIPNYPLRLRNGWDREETKTGEGFEIIYAGSIGPDQMLNVVLESLNFCDEIVHFTLLGDRDLPEAKSLLTTAEKRGLSNRFSLPGWTDYSDLPVRLSRANLGVSLLNPNVENWLYSLGASNKRYEYMRSALPQIADMNPGVRDLIEGNMIGRCVGSFSPSELGSLIQSYVREPKRCLEEGQRARDLHECRYNYQTAFDILVNHVRRRLAQG